MPLSGQFLFGKALWGGSTSAAPMFSTDTLVYEGFSLSDDAAMVLTALRISGPEREVIVGDIPRRNGKFIITDRFAKYEIEAQGVAHQSSAALLDAYMDTIRKNLRTRQGNLDYTDANGTVKRFIATMVGYADLFPERTAGNTITRIPWRALFHCYEPFPTARDYSSSLKSVTTSPDTDVVTNDGSAPAKAVFVVVVNSATGLTAMKVGNDTTGEEIQYTGTLIAGDVLVFDGEAMAVTLNGTEVQFSGNFPSIDPDDNQIRYTTTGSSFDLSCTSKWKDSYL